MIHDSRHGRGPYLQVGEPLQEIELRLVAKDLPEPVQTGSDVVAIIVPHIQRLHREAFAVVPVNARHQPLGIYLVSLGTTVTSIVHPREVFLPAILSGATAVIVAHNHPSGDPTPSEDDHKVTDRLRAAGDLLGIELLDHIVIGKTRFFSFAAGGESPIPS